MPGGGRGSKGDFKYAGYSGTWWTSTEYTSKRVYNQNVNGTWVTTSTEYDSSYAYYRNFSYSWDGLLDMSGAEYYYKRYYALSVRCVKDER
ncbi:hypothetical protein R80B4_02632 [Fibrobacteres bacterium R8-0-B4]